MLRLLTKPTTIGMFFFLISTSWANTSVFLNQTNLIINSDFEYVNPEWKGINVTYSADYAYTGLQSVKYLPGETAFALQTINIPSNILSATLRLESKNINPDINYDALTALITDEAFGTIYATSESFNSPDTNWHHLEISLSNDEIVAVQGKTVNVLILVMRDSIAPEAVFYIDRVELIITQPETVPSVTPTVPSVTPTVPSVTPTVPSVTPTVPSVTPTVPSVTPTVPSVTPTVPSVTPTVPSVTPTVPSVTPTVPSVTPTVPSVTPTVPSVTPTVYDQHIYRVALPFIMKQE